MRGLLKLIGRGQTAPTSAEMPSYGHPLPEPVPTVSNRLETGRTGEIRPVTHCRIPTRRWAAPAEHAAAILQFLQSVGGRTGTITYAEMKEIHADVCFERDWELIGWTAVGRELRKLLGGAKTLDYDANGKRVLVYRIPPANSGVRASTPRVKYLDAHRRR